MEKFLWNAGGVVLFIANIVGFMFCFASGRRGYCILLIVIAALDWLYYKKRPTWVEV